MPARLISDRPVPPALSSPPMTTSDSQDLTPIHHWARFVAGAGWSALVAAFIAGITDAPYATVFAVCLLGLLLAGALVWLTLEARRKRSLPGQFTIGSLLFATCFVAFYFAAVRWVGVKLTIPNGMPSDVLLSYFIAAFPCGLIALISILIAFGMVETLLRAGIWSLRRPLMQASLKKLWRLRGRVDGGSPVRR